jgi:hypothetical protein
MELALTTIILSTGNLSTLNKNLDFIYTDVKSYRTHLEIMGNTFSFGFLNGFFFSSTET